MAPPGFRTWDLVKIALIATLVALAGNPVQGDSEEQVNEKKTPSVKECRAHIDAALEQYWESTSPDEHIHQLEHTDPYESENPESLYKNDEINDDYDDDDYDTRASDSAEEEEEAETEVEEDETRGNRKQQTESDGEEFQSNAPHKRDVDDEDTKDGDEDVDEDEEDGKEYDAAENDEEEDMERTENENDNQDESELIDESFSDSSDSLGGEKEEDDEENENEEENGESEVVDTAEDEEDVGEISKTELNETSERDDVMNDEQPQDEEADEDSNEEGEEEETILSEEMKTEESENNVDESTEDEYVEVSKVEEGDKGEMQEEKEEEEEEEEEGKVHEEKDEEEEEEEIGEKPKYEEGEEEDVEERKEEEEDVEERKEEEKGKAIEDEAPNISDSETRTGNDKATGESYSAESGVAPELSSKRSVPQQPQISEDTEKVSLDQTFSEANDSESLDMGHKLDVEKEEDEEENEKGHDDVEEQHLDGDDDDDDDMIENIYEEEEEEDVLTSPGEPFRSRDHIDDILGLDDIGTEYDQNEEKLAQAVFKEVKKIHMTNVRPMELLYKYTDSTTRRLGDAEIFSKPMVLFLGPWNTGKTTIINYLLGIERTPAALKTGTGITDVDFTIITHGDHRQVISGTELAADWAYAGVQKFGQGFLEHFRAITLPHALLKKITLVDTPGILENLKNSARGYAFNDAFQWFIDRSDAIYVVLDPTKVDVGSELSSVLDQLKGRDVRFILNKADTIRRSDLMRVVGQLFWNLSPLMSSTEAPVIYAVSLSTKPYHPSAPAKFLADQEKNFLYDLRETIDKRIENKILFARRHAVRVRNHAKMVDCYLSTYYSQKSIFSSKKNVAKLITENPKEYKIYEGLGSMTNVSRYDLPDASSYKEFFKMHPLYDFKPLASTCSYFRGCPMDKLDMAITVELPELFAKYKKAKGTSSTLGPSKQNGR